MSTNDEIEKDLHLDESANEAWNEFMHVNGIDGNTFQFSVSILDVVDKIKKFFAEEEKKETKWIYECCKEPPVKEEGWVPDPYCPKHGGLLIRVDSEE